MNIFNVFNLIGGLALFLYGMTTMGDGLSQMAGSKLENILEKLTKNKFMAVLLGAGVTAIIQSSSATTVMVVGFVNSGIMKLSQSVGVIMGANIGTTITSWILSLTGLKGDSIIVNMLKPSSFSPLLAAIGIVLLMIAKNGSKKKDVGIILVGFAILMFGMETMSGAVEGLANNPSFTKLMTAFSNPILGLMAGAVLTAIIQSSSASVGILQALSASGTVTYSGAFPIIMGQNIGTCITSIISSIGANKNAKRAAAIHLFFNLIGTAIFMVAFYTINSFVDFSFLKDKISPAGIAIIHSLFNIGATIILFPFSNLLVKLAKKVVKDGKETEIEDEVSLDDRFLLRPAYAMELCREKSYEMAKLAEKSINIAIEILREYDEKKAKKVIEIEGKIDKYEDVLGSYLVKLSALNMSNADNQSMSIILHSIGDLERISDYALEIVKSSREMKSKKISFSQVAKEELEVLSNAVSEICEITIKSFCEGDTSKASRVEPLEEVIDSVIKKIKLNHINRLKNGESSIIKGFVLQDLLNDFKRISNHCSNIAVEMITIYENEYNTHDYYEKLSQEDKELFDMKYNDYKKKYVIKDNHGIIGVKA